MSILVLDGSSRVGGNTEQLTNIALEAIPHTRIFLREKEIRPIVDKRHDPQGFQPVADDYEEVIQAVLRHEVLVFATPIYWYGMSAQMKLFVDRWSQSLRDKRFDFKKMMAQKQAYVMLTGGDQPRIKGLPLIQQFQYIFSFMDMEFAGYIIGQGNQPGEILGDARAIEEAKQWNCLWKKELHSM